jgi:hypothetical protein
LGPEVKKLYRKGPMGTPQAFKPTPRILGKKTKKK